MPRYYPRRRSRRSYRPSTFKSVSPRQWRHDSRSSTTVMTPTGVKSVVEWEIDGGTSEAEVLLLKDIEIMLQIYPTATAAYSVTGRFYWYYIPAMANITTTTIDKNDPKRIWRPRPFVFVSSANATHQLVRTFRFPKKEISSTDKFGLAVEIDIANSNVSLAAETTFLFAEHG